MPCLDTDRVEKELRVAKLPHPPRNAGTPPAANRHKTAARSSCSKCGGGRNHSGSRSALQWRHLGSYHLPIPSAKGRKNLSKHCTTQRTISAHQLGANGLLDCVVIFRKFFDMVKHAHVDTVN